MTAVSTGADIAPSDASTRIPRDPFDPEYARALIAGPFAPLAEHWFRPKLLGQHKIPLEGPVVIAANHSGNAFPYDAIVLDAFLWQREGLDPRRKLRSLFEPGLTQNWWMRPFGIDDFYRRGGGVDMTFDNFDRLLARGERLLYFPEGVPGIGKGFLRRYRLQRFSTSFVLLAARHRAPVLPLYVINAEWMDPFGVPIKPIDKLMQMIFRVPFLPLPIGLLGVLFPWFWYLSFPARMVFVLGDPIDVRAVCERAGITDFDRADRGILARVARDVRLFMQRELTALAEIHGRHPYHLGALARDLWRHRRDFLRIVPLGWPVTFLRQERDRHRPRARSRLHAVLRDLDLAFFYVPFGWPLLSLARWLRRPPYGYRGLTRRAAREQRGEYVWRLSERPLPSTPATAPRAAAPAPLRTRDERAPTPAAP